MLIFLDECIRDAGNNMLQQVSVTEESYFMVGSGGGDNCSSGYRVQRQAANVRERKRMLRSESRTRHTSDKPPIKM